MNKTVLKIFFGLFLVVSFSLNFCNETMAHPADHCGTIQINCPIVSFFENSQDITIFSTSVYTKVFSKVVLGAVFTLLVFSHIFNKQLFGGPPLKEDFNFYKELFSKGVLHPKVH